MRTKGTIWLVVILILGFSPFRLVSANEVQHVTQGTIGFTGIYEPVGTPDPKPPDHTIRPPIMEGARPDGSLPQTNDHRQSVLIYLGTLILGFVFLVWSRKKKEERTQSN